MFMAKKVTSKRVAKIASRQLKSSQTTRKAKAVAGSALSQREKRRR